MKQTFLITQLFFCLTIQALGQPSSGIEENSDIYQEALNHYEAGHYNLARASFEKYIDNNKGANLGDAHYYRAICAIKLFHNDGEYLMESFITDFPLHSKSSTARFTIGSYYFENDNYTKAISNFEKTKPIASISCDLNFMLGYSYMSKKQFDNAKNTFAKVNDQSCKHYLASNYYRGYLNYRDDELNEALEALKIASQDEDFGRSAALMIGNIYFRNDQYTEAISFVSTLAPATLDNNPELYFIRAGAHFEKKEYNDAVKYYEDGMAKTGNRASSDVFFNMAESYRHIGNKEEAIEKYKLSALDVSETGAYSSYYLGKLYVETGNKPFAKSAFQEALKSEKEVIREEALFQLAKVEFDLGNFSESIKNLQKYAEDFPNGNYQTEAREFITKAFLNTSDYDIAINYIESLTSLSESLKSTYQEVTFLKGADLFNNRQFSASVTYFDKSLKYKMSGTRTVAAHFWKAEAFSIGKLYSDAINSYKSALYTTPESDEGKLIHTKARYGLGYAYYNEKDYPNALANFKTYLNVIPANASEREFYPEDARLRMADCYYVTKDYSSAVSNYSSLLSTGNSNKDYIYFQLGIVNALQSNDTEAKSYFRQVIEGYPSSNYVDNAILQLAEISFEAGEYRPSIAQFSNLINNYSQSSLLPFALVKRALAFSNVGNYPESESDYKKVLDNYISHPTANSALLGLQELSAKSNVSDFGDYLNKYQLANPDDESLETVEFEAAKSLYFNQLYYKAIESFKQFQSKYTNSSLLNDANYFIADSYFRSGDWKESISFLKLVVEDNQNSYQTRSLNRLGDLLARQGNFEEAITYFKRLEKKSRNSRELGNAWEGIMNVYFTSKQYDSTALYTGKILNDTKLSQDLKNKANLVSAKVKIINGNPLDAEDLLIGLINGVKDESAAEASYELALLYYNAGKYKNSLQTLFGLNKNFAQYDQWLGKSFLLIADNYMKQDELFQAKATLNSIIDNASDNDLIQQARKKLVKLEALEKEVVIAKDTTIVIDTLNTSGNND